jgi:hypothetical protein
MRSIGLAQRGDDVQPDRGREGSCSSPHAELGRCDEQDHRPLARDRRSGRTATRDQARVSRRLPAWAEELDADHVLASADHLRNGSVERHE